MLPFIGENNCVPRSPCPFWTWEWDQRSLQNEIVSQCLHKSFSFGSLRLLPPSFSVSWLTFTSTNPHPHPSPLSTPLMPKEAHTCMPTGTPKPAAPPPQSTSHTHSLSHTRTRTQSCFWVPTEVWQKPLDGWHTHTWCYRVRAKDSASWVMRDCHSYCLSMLQVGERGGRLRESQSFFLSLPYITQG